MRPVAPRTESLRAVLHRHPDFLHQRVTITEMVPGIHVRVGRDGGALWVERQSMDPDVSWDAYAVSDLSEWVAAKGGPADQVPRDTTLFGVWRGAMEVRDASERRDLYVYAEQAGTAPASYSTQTLDSYWVNGFSTSHILYEGGHATRSRLEKLILERSNVVLGPIEGLLIAPVVPLVEPDGHQVVATYGSVPWL